MKTTKIRRIKPWQLALTGIVMAMPLVAPSGDAGGPPSFIRTALATEKTPADTGRLVSIGGAVTEIVYALGAGGRLIARDSTSLYPEEAKALPDVGYMRALSPEGVMAVDPSAILAVEGSGPAEALSVLKQANIPFETVPDAYTRDGILAKIDTVGAFLGEKAKADALKAKVAADLDAAIATASAIAPDKRKRALFILSMAGGKVMVSGTGTAADGVMALAGVTNAASAFAGYKPMTDEAIIEAKPDVILMMDRGGNHGASADEVFQHAALSLTPAAETKSVVRMDGLYLLGFGPRTASAVRDLDAAVYGKAHGAQ